MISLKNNNSIHWVLLKDFYEISLLLLPFEYESPQNSKTQFFIPMILQCPAPFLRACMSLHVLRNRFLPRSPGELMTLLASCLISTAGIIVAPSCWPEVDLVIYYLSYTLFWSLLFLKKKRLCINYVKSSFSGKVFLMFLESFLS